MRLQYASDLHLEFPQNKEFLKANPLIPKGDVLLLAGDVVPFSRIEEHWDFFSYVSDHFHTTWWIPGNHEYYHFDLAEKCGTLNEAIRNNVHLVNNVAVQHSDVNFIFSTLWSRISPANQWQIERGMNDFHLISYSGYRFSSERFNQLHEESVGFIASELHRNENGKTVVATHHVPTFLNYPEAYKADVLNEAFAVELYDLIEAFEPECWIYGHHHHNTADFKIGKTNMLTNQLGYVQRNEHVQFDTQKCIEV